MIVVVIEILVVRVVLRVRVREKTHVVLRAREITQFAKSPHR